MGDTLSENAMNLAPAESRQALAPPRVVAISGIIFSVLFVASLVLIRLAVPADPTDPGGWIADARFRDSVRMALNLIPFTGIAFLWFMAVLRNRIGSVEDRFFATVFLGSGLLFVAMLFASAAVAGAMLETFAVEGRLSAQSETFAFGRRTSHALMNIYAIKMAAVFIFVTSSIGFRTAFLPRWLAFVGFAVGLVVLLAITDFAWIALLIPLWVLLVSAYILVADLCERPLGK
jgi:hypothetical protein